MGLLHALKAALSPERQQAIRYECLRCGRQFVYRADLEDPNCPYCDNDTIETVERF